MTSAIGGIHRAHTNQAARALAGILMQCAYGRAKSLANGFAALTASLRVMRGSFNVTAVSIRNGWMLAVQQTCRISFHSLSRCQSKLLSGNVSVQA